jgi:hypothetical protein
MRDGQRHGKVGIVLFGVSSLTALLAAFRDKSSDILNVSLGHWMQDLDMMARK